MILPLKLLMAPVLIAAATLAGRRWGPAVSGWFISFPFISAPISLILAMQNGIDFAAQAAAGTLGGQVCCCMFSAAYLLAAKKLPWWLSAPLAAGAYFGCAAVWNAFPQPLLPAFGLLVTAILLLLALIPRSANPAQRGKAPWWDLPTRMITAVIFVSALTSAAGALGPHLSGLLSSFPVMGIILACFTHAQQGSQAAHALLRGSILGSFAIAAFYLTVGGLLPATGSLLIYLLAAAAAIVANGVTLQFTRPRSNDTGR